MTRINKAAKAVSNRIGLWIGLIVIEPHFGFDIGRRGHKLFVMGLNA